MLYHVMFIPVHNLSEQKPVAKGNETKADAFICRTVFPGISNICAIYTAYSACFSLSGTKRLFSSVRIVVGKEPFQHFVYQCAAGGFICELRILRIKVS